MYKTMQYIDRGSLAVRKDQVVQRHRATSGRRSPIRWRLAAVSVRAAVGSFGRHWSPWCVSRRRRSLAESQPAQAQSEQNSGHVAWVCTAFDEVPVLSSRVRIVNAAGNLSVVVDSQLSMSAQVATVCRGGYYQLRQLPPLKRCMTS